MKYKATWIAAALFWAAAAVLTVSAARAGGFAEFYAEHIYPIFTGSLGRAVGLLPFSLVKLVLYASVIAAICVIIAGIRNIAKKKVSFGAAAAAFFLSSSYHLSIPVRELMISPAMISPATDGTKATEPGTDLLPDDPSSSGPAAEVCG